MGSPTTPSMLPPPSSAHNQGYLGIFRPNKGDLRGEPRGRGKKGVVGKTTIFPGGLGRLGFGGCKSRTPKVVPLQVSLNLLLRPALHECEEGSPNQRVQGRISGKILGPGNLPFAMEGVRFRV